MVRYECVLSALWVRGANMLGADEIGEDQAPRGERDDRAMDDQHTGTGSR